MNKINIGYILCGLALSFNVSAGNVVNFSGSGNTTSTTGDINNPGVVGGLDFTFDIKSKKNSAKGLASVTSFFPNSQNPMPGDLADTKSGSFIDIKCLEVDGDTVWISGVYTYNARDPRGSQEVLDRISDAVDEGRYLFAARLTDNGVPGPGEAVDTRSFFFSGEAKAILPSISPVGSLDAVGTGFLGAKAKNLCKRREAMFDGTLYIRTADDKIQWYDQNFMPFGDPVDNTPENLNNPPPGLELDINALLGGSAIPFTFGDITILD